MKTITSEEFATEVLQSDIPVMVKFTADFCGPCKRMQPMLDTLAEELDGKAKIVKLDIDASREIAAQYKIKSIPAMMVFKDGVVIATQIGSAPKETLVKMFGLTEEKK